ncbi:PrkA AAA domain protein [Planctomycetes bacterium Poly30]|uniref:PrkA AAA domain protein n=1 Tax=Saltatorellus ferox TaxID=2528018 RepID=A0A518ES39_9BACT|nr:PrkA AAA domain protein [Planctomycetes bacterium Poly30]
MTEFQPTEFQPHGEVDSLTEIVRRTVASAPPEELRWSGSFEDYLGLVQRDPRNARNAWQRLSDMIESHGSRPGESAGERPTDRVERWRIFDDPFSARRTGDDDAGDGSVALGSDAVFGLDASLHQLVMTIRAGARGLGPERRLLLLHGPVGSAKSTIARLLKRGLEAYTRTDAGAVYTFDWEIDGEVIPSPMNQDPLLLLDEAARRAVEQRLNRDGQTGYRLCIEGDLDPVSQFWMNALLQRYDGDWSKAVSHVRVRRFVFSEARRLGIGTFQPKDEKNQDSTELTGDLNYRKIAEYGSDSDPRAFNFDGEFNVANRGLIEFIEVLKLDVAFLYDLLGATQEHSIKPKKFQATSIDEVILGHTNEPEYRKLQSNELMEAFRDRTIRIDVPYNLRISDEAAIHRRRFGALGSRARRLAPHSLEMASLWAVLTRLEDPQHPTLTRLQKARLYDGDEVSGFTQAQIEEIRGSAPREGLDGISPRFVQDRIASCLVEDRASVGPREVLDSIEKGLGVHSMVASEEQRKRYLELVAVCRDAYDERIREEVESAIASDGAALDRLCAKYLDNVRAYTSRSKVQTGRGDVVEPDERLMRSIEQRTDIPESRKDDFRHELMNYIAAVHLDGGQFDYRENRRLRRALELKLFDDQKDSIQLTNLVSSVIDPATEEKIAVIRDRLCERFGYDEASATLVLQDVASLFARSDPGGPSGGSGKGEGEAA